MHGGALEESPDWHRAGSYGRFEEVGALCTGVREFPARSALQRDNAIPDGISNEGRRVIEPKLFHNRSTMGFGGLQRDAKGKRDLFVTLAFADQLDDLPLTRSETSGLGAGGDVILAKKELCK